ncbi:MAG TPA: NAD-glutamate dehydrogenase domain-containing protein, partial [Mycobacteriales bacterium]|nr:NAD-glutamate dehydrogenase domain-containing protein [Mycobacteriales bacterium]
MRGDVDETTSDLIERAVHLAASRDTGGTGTGTDSGTDSDTDTDTRTDTSTGSGSGPVDGPLGAFLYRYYRHVAADDLAGRDAAELLGAAISQRELAKRRPQGTSTVRVFSPTVGEHGWDAGHSIVEVVTDDMPFLVDSVTAELSRHGCGIHLVIHPQFVVRRDMVGTLIEVLDLDPALAPAEPDLVVESWIHVEIDRQDDPDRTAILAADLQRVLRDVRETVEDWAKMRAAAGRVADELESDPPAGLPTGEVTEGAALLRWLAEDHFTFLGYREYVLRHDDGGDVLQSVPGTGLGILRSDKLISVSFAKLSPQVRAKAHDKALLILTKANSRATVHRPAYLDYIGVRRFDAAGNPVGERRFLGLFNRAAYAESVRRTPVVREKVAAVLDRLGFSRVSHSGKDLIRILETYPRDELFQISVDDLAPTAVGVLHLQERRQLRLFVRRDDYGRFLSCLVYLPRDRYTTAVRERLQAILLASLGGASVEYTAYVTESVLARLHFVVRMPAGGPLPDLDVPEVERRLADATRSWDEDLVDAIHSHYGEADASSAITRYGRTFPEAYKEDFPARTGVADVRRLESLGGDGELGLNLYEPYLAEPGEHRFKVYRTGTPLSLSAVLPVLQHLGVDVVDERPYEIERAGTSPAWVYDFGLRYDPAVLVESPGVKRRFEEAFAAIWAGDAEDDGFNALVLRGLEWRQVVVLRAYVKHLRQIGSAFSQDYIQSSVLANVGIARLLIELFDARFDPSGAVDPDERERQSSAVAERVLVALDEVASLDEDRILRSLLIEIQATIRTNVFQRTPEGTPKPYVSLKLDPQRIPDLPRPRPRFEIWVYSPRVEGVHLRFGPVARGGLRWSDRREDFRTEVLGLVKAQTVKNAVIVPVGAKGGFVVKRPGDPADREAQLSEGIACYRTFIRGLLDVTDNLVAGVAVPPPDVVRHDGDDAYLVVAADKGTASFSDIANEIALEYGFWLGDAFASGGSAGYDHKTMGITARGAWESVQRHFRELGTDPTTTGYSV